MNWDKLADEAALKKTIEGLKANNIAAIVAENKAEARQKLLQLLPKGAEVMNMTSMTLEALGITQDIVESGKYNSVRKKLMSMDRNKDAAEMQKLGAAPDWVVGSVHAVTQDGHVYIASASGSQLPAYAYGSSHVVWVVGTQKIVKDATEAMKRLKEYTFPLEDARARKAYGVGSGINKLLVVNKEFSPGRITIIFVKENLGF